MKIKAKFNFGDLVKVGLDDRESPVVYKIVSLQVNMDLTISYGCLDQDGDWKWYKDYEIVHLARRKQAGFSLIFD